MTVAMRQNSFVQAAKGTLYVTFLVAALVAGSLFGWLGRSSIMAEALRQKAYGTKPQEVFRNDLKSDRQYLNVLVLGCDEDYVYGGIGVTRHASRSDMMLVAKLDFENNKISGVSIPRDTLVQLPGYETHKINAYHKYGYDEGGPEKAKALAQQATEQVLNIKVDRVVVINFNAFKDIVDMLGGVDVYVPKNMHYEDKAGGLYIDLKKGRQTLNGYQAMGYVRFRKADSDLERQKRQKDFIMAIRSKAVRRWQVSPELIDKSIELMGGTFTPAEVASLALFGQSVGADNIKFDMVPVKEAGRGSLRVDQPALDKLLRDTGFKGPDPS
ncbi:MAG: LCP family protein [Fimbriimonadaceae bacterium]|nr:LCP family protein [Fimbriimonadaceae bacterium]QYK55627.1 MAG: LCP family protein [Fimbriimonadaceae bacterium]